MEKGWLVTILSIAISIISIMMFVFVKWPLFLFLFLPPVLLGFPRGEKEKDPTVLPFCPSCGIRLQGGENYCPNCGVKLK